MDNYLVHLVDFNFPTFHSSTNQLANSQRSVEPIDGVAESVGTGVHLLRLWASAGVSLTEGFSRTSFLMA